jgi:hypothetical protein
VDILKSLQLDKAGDFSEINALNKVDPEMVNKILSDHTQGAGCHTLFVRCYK